MTGSPDRLAAALADRYRIERELGQGGMATVYLATQESLGREVALKLLAERYAPGKGTADNPFLRPQPDLPAETIAAIDGAIVEIVGPCRQRPAAEDERSTEAGYRERPTVLAFDGIAYAHPDGPALVRSSAHAAVAWER